MSRGFPPPVAIRTVQADDDFFEIWATIAEDNPPAADRMTDRIAGAARRLAGRPYLGPAREDLRSGLRYFVVSPYLLFDRVIPEGVEIVRIVHGSRDLSGLFGDEG